MTIFCRLRKDKDVLDALEGLENVDLTEVKARILIGDVFNIRNEQDRLIVDRVYRPIRARLRRGSEPWVTAHSPLRDIVDGAGLKWYGKGTGTRGRERLSHQTVDHRPGENREDAYAHRWIQAQLVRLGPELNQERSSPEFTVEGGRVDVAWDTVAWEVDLSLQTADDQAMREAVRETAGFTMLSLVERAAARADKLAQIPQVVLRGLRKFAQDAVGGSTSDPLATRWVGNVFRFDLASGKWLARERVTLRQFCDALIAGRCEYDRERSGGWHRKACASTFLLRERAVRKCGELEVAAGRLEQRSCRGKQDAAQLRSRATSVSDLMVKLAEVDVMSPLMAANISSMQLARKVVPELLLTWAVWFGGAWWQRVARWIVTALPKGRRIVKRLRSIQHLSGLVAEQRRSRLATRADVVSADAATDERRAQALRTSARTLEAAIARGDALALAEALKQASE